MVSTTSGARTGPALVFDDYPSMKAAIGETERIYGTRWTVIVTLRPGRSFIEERIRIYNPTETIRPYYFWNCTAFPNHPGTRFIYPMTLGTDHNARDTLSRHSRTGRSSASSASSPGRGSR